MCICISWWNYRPLLSRHIDRQLVESWSTLHWHVGRHLLTCGSHYRSPLSVTTRLISWSMTSQHINHYLTVNRRGHISGLSTVTHIRQQYRTRVSQYIGRHSAVIWPTNRLICRLICRYDRIWDVGRYVNMTWYVNQYFVSPDQLIVLSNQPRFRQTVIGSKTVLGLTYILG